MAEPSPSTFQHVLRVLCASLMASLVVVLVAIAVTLGSDGTGSAPVWAFGVLVAVAAADVVLVTALGYRFRPIPPGTAEQVAREDSARQLQTTTILRFALCEAVALVAIALSFVVDEGGLYLVVLGVAAAELLMLRHVWPGETMVSRVQEALESEGGRSYLREALDAPAPGRV